LHAAGVVGFLHLELDALVARDAERRLVAGHRSDFTDDDRARGARACRCAAFAGLLSASLVLATGGDGEGDESGGRGACSKHGGSPCCWTGPTKAALLSIPERRDQRKGRHARLAAWRLPAFSWSTTTRSFSRCCRPRSR